MIDPSEFECIDEQNNNLDGIDLIEFDDEMLALDIPLLDEHDINDVPW